MKIIIQTLPHEQQRYDTPGDWFETQISSMPSAGECLHINVSAELFQADPRFAYLVAIHELVEALLCKVDGVTAKSVDVFDVKWHRRTLPDGTEITEPGEDPLCPCHEQHVMAEIVERIVAQAMAVHWPSYGTAVDRIWNR